MTGCGQAATATVQLALLALVGATTGLGPAGWLSGIAFTAALLTVLTAGLVRAGRARLGPADVVTLARALLVGVVTALVADELVDARISVGLLAGVATVAVVLDGVDGRVARRTGTASPLGARFDMEVDAALIMVLSVHAALLVGPWALAIGLMRYAFVGAGRVWPWLRAPLPPSYIAKTVAVVQAAALVVVGTALLPPTTAVTITAAALGLLAYSFGRDVLRLHVRAAAHAGTGARVRTPIPM